ncbi:hypothetical protein Micbo1qcDRAFT_159403, partial [Microdochium bolleyi]
MKRTSTRTPPGSEATISSAARAGRVACRPGSLNCYRRCCCEVWPVAVVAVVAAVVVVV